MFSKKATKIDEIFTVAFLENTNLMSKILGSRSNERYYDIEKTKTTRLFWVILREILIKKSHDSAQWCLSQGFY